MWGTPNHQQIPKNPRGEDPKNPREGVPKNHCGDPKNPQGGSHKSSG